MFKENQKVGTCFSYYNSYKTVGVNTNIQTNIY